MLSYPLTIYLLRMSVRFDSLSPPRLLRGLATFVLLLVPAVAYGVPADTLETARAARLRTIGSPAEQRLRTAQLFGRAPLDGSLIRSPSSTAWGDPGGSRRWQLLVPEATAIWNSTIPFSFNEGTLWAGRGISMAARAGARARWRAVSVTFAPEVVHISNHDFRIVPGRDPDRSAFASPWHDRPGASADLPVRFGNMPLTVVAPGQTALAVAIDPLEIGLATENQWWGPGIRNAIVMSNHAPGIPHLFLRTTSPVPTRIGSLEAKWIAGLLTESIFFDDDPANDHRSLAGLVLTFRPAAEPNLEAGLSRVVYRGVERPLDAALRGFDVLTSWETPPPVDDGEQADGGDRPDEVESDQMLSFFARWIFPRNGFEIYGEWARVELPLSMRDLLTSPDHTLGYTLGVQWAAPRGDRSVVRLQAEVTTLEKSPTFTNRPVPTYYLGRSAAQGYTQRGQVVGASIGPGASSQWLALDYLRDASSAGLFAGRVRWENDALYELPLTRWSDHDVTIFGGMRVAGRLLSADWQAEGTLSRRYNYLFQRALDHPVRPQRAMDLNNATLRIEVAPVARTASPRIP